MLNHLDYIDARVRDLGLTPRAQDFLEQVEASIGRRINWLGTGPATVIDR